MKTEKLKEFLDKIKVHYPTFEINNNVIIQWGKELNSVGLDALEEAFEIHLKDFPLYEPKLHIIKNSAYKIVLGRKLIQDMNFRCSKCLKIHEDYDGLQKCEERHLRIKYIERMCNIFKLRVADEFGIIEDMTLKEIDLLYERFMLKLCKLQKENKILNGMQEQGLRSYYVNIFVKKGIKI